MSASMAGCRFNANGIPDELKALARWVRFDLEYTAGGKLKKTPYVPGTTWKASPANSKDWRPFDVAVADALQRGQYVGFVFDCSLPYVFVDLDDAIGTHGVLRSGAARVVDAVRAYTEKSAGSNGLHVVCRGSLPERIQIAPELRPIEVYPLRGPRFCVFTGHLLPVDGNLEAGIPDRSPELAALFPARPPRTTAGRANATDQPHGELAEDECAAVVAWAAPYWTAGRRHHMALYLSGVLARQGVPRAQAAAIIERCANGDVDPGTKIAACHDTFDDLSAGADVSGWCGLRERCGLSNDDLAPLDAILGGFWRRMHPRLVLGGRLRVGHSRLRVREAFDA